MVYCLIDVTVTSRNEWRKHFLKERGGCFAYGTAPAPLSLLS